MKKVNKGGITYGNSHEKGGIPVKNSSTGQMLEVEGGEGIVNKRSMASDKMVKINGKEMTICEAVSQLNQMEGGVRFSCDDVEHRQFIEEMAQGGELERGKRTEKEHIETLRKLYEKRITPSQATAEVAKEHLKEDPNYYSKLAKMESGMGDGGMADNLDLYVNMFTTKMEEYETITNLNILKSLEKNGLIELNANTGQTKNITKKEVAPRTKPSYEESRIWDKTYYSRYKLRFDDIKSAKSPEFTFKGTEYFVGYKKGSNFLNFYILKKGKDWNKYNSQRKMGDGGMSKEEKRARIAHMKKKIIIKAKQGTKVEDGKAPAYPKINEFAPFFDKMAEYQDAYKRAVASHEKIVQEGLKIKANKSIPKKQKEAQLDKLRQQLLEDKAKLKTARENLAKLPEMKSPFYAPKLEEGGQIVNGMTTFKRAEKGDVGSLTIKPIKEDITLYKLPKTGFGIDWIKSGNGDYVFTCFIGKRSLGHENYVRQAKYAFEGLIQKLDFITLLTQKSFFEFKFYSRADNPLDGVTKFVNFLRFLGNSAAFSVNYDPTTQSVYSKGGGSESKEDTKTYLEEIVSYTYQEILHIVTFDYGHFRKEDQTDYDFVLSYFENVYKSSVDIKDFAKAFVIFQQKNPDFQDYSTDIQDFCFNSQNFLKAMNLYAQTRYALTRNPTMRKIVPDSVLTRLWTNQNNSLVEYEKIHQDGALKVGNTLQIRAEFFKLSSIVQTTFFLYLLKK